MRVSLALFGLLCVALALTPNVVLLTALQSGHSVEALAAGANVLRASLAVVGIYFITLSRLVPEAAHDVELIHYDIAPPHSLGILLAILALAVALRAYALDRDIWFDEMLMHTGYMDLKPLSVLTTFNDANNHILYTFLARLSIEAFGDAVWAIRLPSVVFGLASIAAIYAFSRRVMTWQESLLAALILTVSFHHIWFSQNARGYTALLFFSLVSSIFLLDAMRTGQVWRWLAYAVTGTLGAYTHLTIGFLFVGHFFYFLYVATTASRSDEDRPAIFWPGLGFGFVPLGLLTVTLYAIVLPDILGGALLSTGLQEDSEWTNPVWALRELVTSLQIGFSGSWAILAGAIVVVIGMLSFLRRDAAAVAFLVIPCGLAVLLMTAIGYTLFPRFFFFAMGFGVVIVVHGATILGRLAARLLSIRDATAVWIALLPGLVIAFGSALSLRHVYFSKQSYLASIDYLEQRLEPGDGIAVIGVAELPYIDYYGKAWTPVNSADEIEAMLETQGRVWAVYTLPVAMRSAHPDILALLEERFTTAETFYGTLGGGEIIVSVSGLANADS